ncbi:hypothetical protein WDU94_007684 [Cyamophila willieti]
MSTETNEYYQQLDELSLEQLLQLHLNCALPSAWTILESHLHGRGLFATRDIEEGEVIFKDQALVLGPRSGTSCPPVCVGCFSSSNPLHPCTLHCRLPVCSSSCQTSSQHQIECGFLRAQEGVQTDKAQINWDLLRAVTPLRCLRMSKLKRKIMKSLESSHFQICEVDLLKRHLHRPLSSSEEAYLRLCCGILDTNAYGGSGGGEDNKSLNFRGLYALSAIMNHCCRPNTTYWFDADQRMVVKASSKIKEGEEILSTYSSLLWGTAMRRSFLRNTKEFECRCLRCKDPTEFGSNLSAIYCKVKPCPGLLLPSNPLDLKSDWTAPPRLPHHSQITNSALTRCFL